MMGCCLIPSNTSPYTPGSYYSKFIFNFDDITQARKLVPYIKHFRFLSNIFFKDININVFIIFHSQLGLPSSGIVPSRFGCRHFTGTVSFSAYYYLFIGWHRSTVWQCVDVGHHWCAVSWLLNAYSSIGLPSGPSISSDDEVSSLHKTIVYLS